MKKFIMTAVLSLLATALSFSQSPRSYYHISNGWTDLNISGKIAENSLELENQQRRQDMQGITTKVPLLETLIINLNQHVFRPWVHFQLNPNVRFSLMPFGWIGSNRFSNGSPSAFFSEYRISPQLS
jgi:hypothetical protein